MLTPCTILKMCENRGDDKALAVKRRIMSCSDLLVAEGQYHQKYQDTFNLDSKLTKSIISLHKKGRTQSVEQLENPNKLCEWLEKEGELYSLSEFFDKMKELAKPSTNVCATKKYLKEKLQLKYKQNVYLFIIFFRNKFEIRCCLL